MFRFPEQRLSVRKSAFLGTSFDDFEVQFNKCKDPMIDHQVQGGSGEFGWVARRGLKPDGYKHKKSTKGTQESAVA